MNINITIPYSIGDRISFTELDYRGRTTAYIGILKRIIVYINQYEPKIMYDVLVDDVIHTTNKITKVYELHAIA